MENLAGREDCDVYIEKELTRARVEVVRGERRDHEVPASITGRSGPFTFTRAWYYWVVEGKVPLTVAKELYADPVGKTDIRVAGHCGCPAPEAPWLEWYDKEGRQLITMKEAAKACRDGSKSKFIADAINGFLHDQSKRFVHNLTEEGEAFVTSYHIDTEVGLRLFVDTIKKHGLV